LRLAPLFAVLGLAAALLAPSAATAAGAPPPPTGTSPVGMTRVTLVDTHRVEHLAVESGGPRMIPLRVWYPAARTGRYTGRLRAERPLPSHLDASVSAAQLHAPGRDDTQKRFTCSQEPTTCRGTSRAAQTEEVRGLRLRFAIGDTGADG
jgi:hypothetical protein